MGISKEEKGEVMCLDETRHGFEDGDWVVFKEVEGMTQINGKEFQIAVTGPYSFKIGDTSGFSDYTTKGIVTQVKKEKKKKKKKKSPRLNPPLKKKKKKKKK